VYKRLFVLCVALNAVGLVLAATGHFPYARAHAAVFAMGNILALTLCRSEAVLRVVFWLAVALFGRPWVPVVVKTGVWDGKRWQLVAFRAAEDRFADPSTKEICVAVMPYSSPPSAGTGGALGCGGFSVAPPGSPGGLRGINYGSSQSAELPHWAAGPVVDSAAEVALYFRDGHVLRIPTFTAPESLGVRFYATQIPDGPGPDSEPVKVVGLDNGGNVVACAPLCPASTSC